MRQGSAQTSEGLARGLAAGTVENLWIACFGLLAGIGLWRHELWRDETQSWLLARDSASLLELWHNTYYEGHPLLWHGCLYGLSRLGHSLAWMQGFNWLLGLGTVTLLVKKSPFSIWQKGLMALGYFFLYEYTVIARSYGLGVFLVFLFCALYCQSKPRPWAMTLTLGLLANTSVLGVILSGAFAIALYARPRPPRLYTHGAALLIAWSLALVQIGRSLFNPSGLAGFSAGADKAAGVPDRLPQSLENLNKLLQIVLKSYLPLPVFREDFWNKHWLNEQVLRSPWSLWALLVSLLLTFALIWLAISLLRKSPLFLAVYVLGSLGLVSFFSLIHLGTTRHHGHLFVLFIACLWLARGGARDLPAPRSAPRQAYGLLLTGLLAVHSLAGLWAWSVDLRYPFSASAQTARLIKTQHLSALPIIGINQRPVSPLSGYLDRPLYYPEARSVGSFWDISYPEFHTSEEIIQALEGFSRQHGEFVVVLSEPVASASLMQATDLKVTYQAYIGPTIVEDEDYTLYKIERVRE